MVLFGRQNITCKYIFRRNFYVIFFFDTTSFCHFDKFFVSRKKFMLKEEIGLKFAFAFQNYSNSIWRATVDATIWEIVFFFGNFLTENL